MGQEQTRDTRPPVRGTHMKHPAGPVWRRAMPARPLTLTVITLTMVTLAGCGLIERQPDGMSISNLTDRTVVVQLEGTEFKSRTEVSPNGLVGSIGLLECRGTSITVQWEDGSPLATLDKPACPRTILRILKDETVHLRSLTDTAPEVRSPRS